MDHLKLQVQAAKRTYAPEVCMPGAALDSLQGIPRCSAGCRYTALDACSDWLLAENMPALQLG